MKESLFRRLLHSLLDRRERANAMAKIAAVVAGLMACALALSPMLQAGPSMQPGHFAGASADHAPAGVNGAQYLPAYQKPAGADDGLPQIETF